MKIDIDAYRQAVKDGTLGHDWKNCMLAVAAGAKSEDDCVTKGWPRWLAEWGIYYFDRHKDGRDAERGERFLEAVQGVENWDRVFRDWRLDSILPISLESIGDGDEAWLVAYREAVQWSIDNDGAANPKAAGEIGVVWAAMFAEAAGAEWAAMEAGAAVLDRIEESFFKVVERNKQG